MNTKITNNEVLVVINEACCLMECIFRDGVSTQVFEAFNAKYKTKPGYFICYGTNIAQGGEDKSILVVYYNKAVNYRTATADLEILLRSYLGIESILWKRDIDRGTKRSNVLAEVC